MERNSKNPTPAFDTKIKSPNNNDSLLERSLYIVDEKYYNKFKEYYLKFVTSILVLVLAARH